MDPKNIPGRLPACVLAFCLLGAGFSPEDLASREYKDRAGAKLLYRLYKPVPKTTGEKFPLVLFLHGAGERGDDNAAQLTHGVKFFLERENEYPCFIVAPQVPKNEQWVNTPWGNPKHTIPEKPSESMRLTLDLLGALEKEFPEIDSKRIYVTGLSMGGFGAWDILMRQPKMFAAAVPICGGADDTRAALIAKIPVWAFHGGADDVVKTARSRNIVAALKAAGGSPRYTEYPGVGHQCWDQAYSSPELFQWLFGQSLR